MTAFAELRSGRVLAVLLAAAFAELRSGRVLAILAANAPPRRYE